MNEAQKKILIVAVIFFITAASRFIFFEQHFGGFSYDSGSFTLAVQDYDITEWRPHLPGYYLYIQTIKLFLLFTPNTHLAMKWILVLFSSLAMALLYWVLRNWFDNILAVLMVALTLTNPIVWFYGCVSEIYAFDLFFGIALVGLCYSAKGIYFSPFFLGFFSGFRPSSAVLLFPLCVLLWYRHVKYSQSSGNKIIIAHLIGIFGLLLWLIPTVNTVGGLPNYISLYQTHNPVEKISLLQNWYRMSSYTVYILFPLLILGIVGMLSRKKAQFNSQNKIPSESILILLWWLIPPLLFFVIFHYSKGYYLLIAIPIFAVTVFIFRRMVFTKRWLLAVCVAVQTLFFIVMPYREPDVQTHFSPPNRHMNLAQVWWERTLSVFLMAQSQIRSLDETGSEFEIALSAMGDQPKGKSIFLDPTFPINPRAMQAKYAHLEFTRFSYREHDSYQLYTGLRAQSRTGFKNMIANALIVSRSDFVNEYLNDIPKSIHYSGNIVFFTVPREYHQLLSSRYEHLFSQTR